MKTRKKVGLISSLAVAIALIVFAIITFAKRESIQGNTYKQEDLMARYTRDRMFYRAGERGEINLIDKSKYFEILKKVLADYPRSSFAPAWQLAIATATKKLGDFQKVIRDYRGHDFISAIAYTKIGEIYRSEGKDKKAKKSFRKAISLIDRCIKSEPKNAVYNYHKAIIMAKEKNEPLDFHWRERYPDGRLMHPDIFSELRKGNDKDYCSTPYLEMNVITKNFSSIRGLTGSLMAQGNYYEKKEEIDKAIETYETMQKIGKHYLHENQNLLRERYFGIFKWNLGQMLLERLFKKNNMMEKKRELDKASKIVKERENKVNQILSLASGYGKAIINKDLSDLPAEFQVDKEKTIRELREEAIDIIEKNNLIRDKNLETRIGISYILSRLGGEVAIAILKEGLNDKDPYVRFLVKKLLEEH
ncbi:MAG: hypothetical protein KAX20_02345 [Candidatus Omnitrophica bacterium]|nr:hypothetical protein [Candidatus Omnitrophota bacterium]